MSVEVVPANDTWPADFARVARDLRQALRGIPLDAIEHVGSTSVPGLAAKPIIDIDVLVPPAALPDAIAALERAGYEHRGDLGIPGRESFRAPDRNPRRNVYVSSCSNVHIRNHLAVRDTLRARGDLRDEYARVKISLASDPDMDIDTYVARKTAVLQRIFAESDLTTDELAEIRALNDPDGIDAK